MGLMDRNIFKILPENTPARMVSNIRDANFQRRFFNTVKGLGCRVVIPDKEGAGCMIVVDGTSDLPLPSGFPNPYDPAAIIFPAIVTNSPGDGAFTEAVYDETASAWIAQPTAPKTGTVTEYHHSVARVQDNTQGWLIEFTGDDGTLLYFSIAGFVKGSASTDDVMQYIDDATDGLGPEWGCLMLK